MHGLDWQTLVNRIGVSRQWVVAIEKGISGAEVGWALRALDTLNVGLSVSHLHSERKQATSMNTEIVEIVNRARRRKDDF